MCPRLSTAPDLANKSVTQKETLKESNLFPSKLTMSLNNKAQDLMEYRNIQHPAKQKSQYVASYQKLPGVPRGRKTQYIMRSIIIQKQPRAVWIFREGH